MPRSTLIKTYERGSLRCSFAEDNGQLIICTDKQRPERVYMVGNPEQRNLHSTPLGIQPPTADFENSGTPLVVGSSTFSGDMAEGTYFVCFTWYSPELRIESNPSARVAVTLTTGQTAIEFGVKSETGNPFIPMDLEEENVNWARQIRVYRSLLNETDITEVDITAETAGNYYLCKVFDMRAMVNGAPGLYPFWGINSAGDSYVAGGAGQSVGYSVGDIVRDATGVVIGTPTDADLDTKYICRRAHTLDKNVAYTTFAAFRATAGNEDIWEAIGSCPTILDRPDTGENGIAFQPTLKIHRRPPSGWWDIEYFNGRYFYTGAEDEDIYVGVTNGSDTFTLSTSTGKQWDASSGLLFPCASGWIGREIELRGRYRAGQSIDVEGQIAPSAASHDRYVITHVPNWFTLRVKKLPLDDSWTGYEGVTDTGIPAVVRAELGEIAFCEAAVEDRAGQPVPDYVPGTNRLFYRPGDGQGNECLVASRDICYVIQPHSIGYFTKEYAKPREIERRVVRTLGKRGIARDPHGRVFFMSNDGIWMLDGSPLPPRRVSDDINDMWAPRTSSRWTWNINLLHQCTMGIHQRLNMLVVFGPSAGWNMNNIGMCMDLENGQWWTLLPWVDSDRTDFLVFSDITSMRNMDVDGANELVLGGRIMTQSAIGLSNGIDKDHVSRLWIMKGVKGDEIPTDKQDVQDHHEIHYERRFTPIMGPGGENVGVHMVEVLHDPNYRGNDYFFTLHEWPAEGSNMQAHRGTLVKDWDYHRGSLRKSSEIFTPGRVGGKIIEPAIYGFVGEQRDRTTFHGAIVHSTSNAKPGQQ